MAIRTYHVWSYFLPFGYFIWCVTGSCRLWVVLLDSILQTNSQLHFEYKHQGKMTLYLACEGWYWPPVNTAWTTGHKLICASEQVPPVNILMWTWEMWIHGYVKSASPKPSLLFIDHARSKCLSLSHLDQLKGEHFTLEHDSFYQPVIWLSSNACVP